MNLTWMFTPARVSLQECWCCDVAERDRVADWEGVQIQYYFAELEATHSRRKLDSFYWAWWFDSEVRHRKTKRCHRLENYVECGDLTVGCWMGEWMKQRTLLPSTLATKWIVVSSLAAKALPAWLKKGSWTKDIQSCSLRCGNTGLLSLH